MNSTKTRKIVNKTPVLCTNCGFVGHIYKQCVAPVTSHGVIVFRVKPNEKGSWNSSRVLTESETAITGLENSGPVEFLLIQRRDSLGFVEVMRGKYKLNEYEYIVRQLSGLTKRERERILSLPFQQLWDELWGLDHSNFQYKAEKENSKIKFETLISKGLTNPVTNKQESIKEILDALGPGWETPEWGFPKGRRDPYETERTTCLREMEEETGIRPEDVTVVENLEPLQETFFGTNNIHYCHKYRIVFISDKIKVEYDPTNEHMRREIGDLGWFSFEDAIERIRKENVEKREVLYRANTLLRNFCPFVLKSIE
jgi:8-oxo-dGTP pyrophosphatase MutT (NUDIX family)